MKDSFTPQVSPAAGEETFSIFYLIVFKRVGSSICSITTVLDLNHSLNLLKLPGGMLRGVISVRAEADTRSVTQSLLLVNQGLGRRETGLAHRILGQNRVTGHSLARCGLLTNDSCG